jgi:hypothetical protein
VVVRALLLAVATVVLIALDRRTMIPLAVSAYAIAQAYAVTRTALKTAAVNSHS